MAARLEVDVAVIGGGAAGLSLADRLCGEARSFCLIEPFSTWRPERTWCWWEKPEGRFDALLSAQWNRIGLTSPDGTRLSCDIEPLVYKMLRSSELERHVRRAIHDRSGAQVLDGVATDVDPRAERSDIRVVTADGPCTVNARWVFDSRPGNVLPAARTTLLQHFRGWFVSVREPRFAPAVAVLMDFQVPQPPDGTAFAYVLPFSPTEALVEFTVFSREMLPKGAYDSRLEHYLDVVLGARGLWQVTATEHGVIPMTDGRFSRQEASGVFRLGAAAGATRPATGYTFAGIQRQCDAVVSALRDGAPPLPPNPHRGRHLVMDAALLRALARGRIDAPSYFLDLFRRHRPEQVLRFLDGESTVAEEIALGLGSPIVPMAASLLELPFLRRHSARRGAPEASGP